MADDADKAVDDYATILAEHGPRSPELLAFESRHSDCPELAPCFREIRRLLSGRRRYVWGRVILSVVACGVVVSVGFLGGYRQTQKQQASLVELNQQLSSQIGAQQLENNTLAEKGESFRKLFLSAQEQHEALRIDAVRTLEEFDHSVRAVVDKRVDLSIAFEECSAALGNARAELERTQEGQENVEQTQARLGEAMASIRRLGKVLAATQDAANAERKQWWTRVYRKSLLGQTEVHPPDKMFVSDEQQSRLESCMPAYAGAGMWTGEEWEELYASANAYLFLGNFQQRHERLKVLTGLKEVSYIPQIAELELRVMETPSFRSEVLKEFHSLFERAARELESSSVRASRRTHLEKVLAIARLAKKNATSSR